MNTHPAQAPESTSAPHTQMQGARLEAPRASYDVEGIWHPCGPLGCYHPCIQELAVPYQQDHHPLEHFALLGEAKVAWFSE